MTPHDALWNEICSIYSVYIASIAVGNSVRPSAACGVSSL
jgi:hypothetical protein